MMRTVARKLLALPLALVGVTLLIFVAVRALPGDPARMMAGPEATQGAVDAMRARLGLDRPFVVQYAAFLGQAARGDFGMSIHSHRPVAREVLDRLPYSASLAVVSYGLAILVGVPAGMLSAIRRGRWADQAVMLLAIGGASIASFWLALLFMELFSVTLGWLPLLGAGSWRSYVMPSVVLAVLPAALIARMTRASVIEVLGLGYIRTARAKGLGEMRVHGKHALRNALVPIVTIVGLNFGSLVGGAVVTESVFNWPGLGRLLVDSVRYRDYPVLQAVILLAVVSVVVVNLAAELLIVYLNPRARLA